MAQVFLIQMKVQLFPEAEGIAAHFVTICGRS